MKKHFSPSSSLASCKTNYVCGSQTCTTRTTWGKLCVSQSFVASSSKLCQSEWCSCLLACLLVGSGCEYVCCCNSLVHRAISKVCSTSLCYFEFISQSLDGEDAETHITNAKMVLMITGQEEAKGERERKRACRRVVPQITFCYNKLGWKWHE